MPEEAKKHCKDIARQLVEDNLDIQVWVAAMLSTYTMFSTVCGNLISHFFMRTTPNLIWRHYHFIKL